MKLTLKIAFDDLLLIASIWIQSGGSFVNDTLNILLSGSEIAGSSIFNTSCCHKLMTKLFGFSIKFGDFEVKTFILIVILVQYWLSLWYTSVYASTIVLSEIVSSYQDAIKAYVDLFNCFMNKLILPRSINFRKTVSPSASSNIIVKFVTCWITTYQLE